MMQQDCITVGDFVMMLMSAKQEAALCKSEPSSCAGSSRLAEDLSLSELLRYGHFRLWLEDSDECHPEALLNRQSAARIIHQFLKIECGVQDLADISAAQELKDLYTCRVCANHIAQVYARNIMSAQEYEGVLFFNHLERLSRGESEEIIKKVLDIIK